MKTTKRFENAVTKLYTAFHDGTLNAMDCKACAVGNMCNKTDGWEINYNSSEAIKTGYNPIELINIENIFMHGRKPNSKGYFYFENGKYNSHDIYFGWRATFVNNQNKDLVFYALTKVVEYLCEGHSSFYL